MTGPFFSLCHWIGIARIKRLESRVLHFIKLMPRLLGALGAILTYYFILVAFVASRKVLEVLTDDDSMTAIVLGSLVVVGMYVYALAISLQRKNLIRFWLCLLAVPVFVGVSLTSSIIEKQPTELEMPSSIPVSFILAISFGFCLFAFLTAIVTFHADMNHRINRWTHLAFRKLRSRVNDIFGFVPFPLNRLSNSYNFHQSLWLQIWSPVLLFLFCLSFTAILAFLLVGLPFWIAEQLRQILTPHRPLFLDLIMYAMSFATIIILVVGGFW
jgi:hypothetical protein